MVVKLFQCTICGKQFEQEVLEEEEIRERRRCAILSSSPIFCEKCGSGHIKELRTLRKSKPARIC